MTTDKLAQIHACLIEKPTAQQSSRRSQIRALFHSINEARHCGRSYDSITTILNENGITISTAQLYKELCIIRKELDSSNKANAAKNQNKKSNAPLTSNNRKPASHDPRDLDEITGTRPDLSSFAKAFKEK